MRESFSKGMMSEALFEDIFKKALSYANGDRLYLSFQGGEPLLRGKAFFEFVGKLVSPHPNVSAVIQTNGTLIDDEWIDIFKKHNFLIGISLDGAEENNRCRVTADGAPAFPDIMRGIGLLKRRGVPFNVLTVLSRSVVVNIDEIYDFYKAQDFKFLQFIPFLKPLDGQPYDPDSYPTEEEYAVFLKKLFARYLADIKDGKYISIRQFDNFVRLAHGKSAEQCGMNGFCSHQFVIEADGTVYPCDFYCLDEFELGNIAATDFSALAVCPAAKNFIRESLRVSAKCKACPYFKLCGGGCKRERRDVEKCGAYQALFKAYLSEMKKIY